jgi:long-chain fatty acid transport protein
MRRIFIFFSVLLSLPAVADGLHSWQLSGSHVGDNAAGAAAIANSATTAYYNPAGLYRVQYQDLAFSLIGQINSVKFNGQIETDTITSGTIQGGQTVILPNLQYAAPITEKIGFGFTITSPYNLNLNYGKDAFSRDLLTQLKIMTTNLGISLGCKLFEHIALGIGIDSEYLKFRLDRLDAKILAQTGLSKNKFSDWGWGFNGSVLLEMSPKTRLGLIYYSKIEYYAVGDSQFSSNDTLNKTKIKSTLELPDSVMLSLYHDSTKQFALLGSLYCTRWHSAKSLNLNNVATADTPINILISTPLKNTWGFSIGTHYSIDDHTILRLGFGYDQTPTTDRSRSLIIPDADRYTASIGLGYQLTNTIGFDIGYCHVFMPHKDITHTQSINTQNIITTGQLSNKEDTIGIQFNWKMT